MKIRKNIATSDEGFIFNPATGDSFSTNFIGNELIRLLKEGKTNAAITESVCSKYDIDKSVFERDFEDFILQLTENKILE